MGELEAKGRFVSSKEFPAHDEKMGIWVPWRLSRKAHRDFQEIGRRARLDKDTPEFLSEEAASEAVYAWLGQIGLHWNWKGVDGTPLTDPSEDPSILDSISESEFAWILGHISDGTAIPPRRPAA